MSTTSAVSSATASAANPLDSAVSSATKMLSQQDFLNLLVTQMTSQDPLKPIDNQDMLSQMVQFSTLQGNTSMQTTLSSLRSTQNFTQAAAMLGKQVTLQVDANTATQGVVTGIDVTTGTPKIVVNNQAYDLGQVLSVTNPSAAGTGTSSTPVLTPTTTTASGLVPTLGTAPAAPAQSNH